MKYDTSESPINATIRTIVALWRIFSGPRRSNLPKSPDPGMIESPAPLDWSPTTMMIMIARIVSAIVIVL
jgi:hypothetical protein